MDKNVKNVKKFIVILKWLVGRRELNMIDDKLFFRLLSKEFESFAKVISSEQMCQINELVDCASDYWQMIPDDVLEKFSCNDYFRIGFVNAVLRMMQILGIDENRVKR